MLRRLALCFLAAFIAAGCPPTGNLGSVGDVIDSGNPFRPGPEQVFVVVRNESGLNAFVRVSMRINGLRIHLAERRLSADRNLLILGPEETDSITFEGFRGISQNPAEMQSTPIEVRERGRDFQAGDTVVFVIPPVPNFGACCTYSEFTASCAPASLADCAANGGVFLGTGTSCAQTNCPLRGACCLNSGVSCTLLTATECTTQGGSYLGDGESCTSAGCFVQPPLGACCLNNNSCEQLTETACVLRNGTFQGANSPCETADCAPPPPPTGACCFQDGACSQSTQSACENAGGVFRGNNTTCATTICPVTTQRLGACCLLDAACLNLTREDCENFSGTFIGAGSSCSAVGCIDLRLGACCLSDGGCQLVLESDCSLAGGAFRGPGSPCATADCPQPPPPPLTGACCLPTAFSCSVTTESACAALTGTYLGNGTICEPDPCEPPPASGACCVSYKGGADCILTTQAECVEFHGGSYEGDGTICEADACANTLSGACCFVFESESYCFILPEVDCSYNGGIFRGMGTNCVTEQCPTPPLLGACCLSGGTQSVCTLLLGPVCNESGGFFFGPGSRCEQARCDLTDFFDTADVDLRPDAPFPRNSYRVYPRGGDGGAPQPLQSDESPAADEPTEPSIVFDAPLADERRIAGEPLIIGWAARDDDSNARIWILIDPLPMRPGDSILLRSAVAEDDVQDRDTVLDTAALAPGAYQIFAIISDGQTMKIVRGPRFHINPAGDSDTIDWDGH